MNAASKLEIRLGLSEKGAGEQSNLPRSLCERAQSSIPYQNAKPQSSTTGIIPVRQCAKGRFSAEMLDHPRDEPDTGDRTSFRALRAVNTISLAATNTYQVILSLQRFLCNSQEDLRGSSLHAGSVGFFANF